MTLEEHLEACTPKIAKTPETVAANGFDAFVKALREDESLRNEAHLRVRSFDEQVLMRDFRGRWTKKTLEKALAAAGFPINGVMP